MARSGLRCTRSLAMPCNSLKIRWLRNVCGVENCRQQTCFVGWGCIYSSPCRAGVRVSGPLVCNEPPRRPLHRAAARMAKLVDAWDLKSPARKGVPVRFRLRAPSLRSIERLRVLWIPRKTCLLAGFFAPLTTSQFQRKVLPDFHGVMQYPNDLDDLVICQSIENDMPRSLHGARGRCSLLAYAGQMKAPQSL